MKMETKEMLRRRNQAIKINNETLPTRCEICHQADLFNAESNYCLRCSQVAVIGNHISLWQRLLGRIAVSSNRFSDKKFVLYIERELGKLLSNKTLRISIGLLFTAIIVVSIAILAVFIWNSYLVGEDISQLLDRLLSTILYHRVKIVCITTVLGCIFFCSDNHRDRERGLTIIAIGFAIGLLPLIISWMTGFTNTGQQSPF